MFGGFFESLRKGAENHGGDDRNETVDEKQEKQSFHYFESVDKLPSSLKRIVDSSKARAEKGLMLRFGRIQLDDNRQEVDRVLNEFLNNPVNMQERVVDWESGLMNSSNPEVTEKDFIEKFSENLLNYVSDNIFGGRESMDKIGDSIVANIDNAVRGMIPDSDDTEVDEKIKEITDNHLLEIRNAIKYSKVSDREALVEKFSKRISEKVLEILSLDKKNLSDDLENTEKLESQEENNEDVEKITSELLKRIKTDKLRLLVNNVISQFLSKAKPGEDAASLVKKALNSLRGNDDLHRLAELELQK